MNRAARRAIGRRLGAMDAAAKAGADDFRRELGTGRQIVAVERLPLPWALAHPLFGHGVERALAAAFGSAHGIGTGLVGECFGCRAAWKLDRPPAEALALVFGGAGAAMVGLLCRACCALPDTEARAVLLAGVRRDFLADARPVPAAAFAPAGGHA